jgi:hypothetical protein
MNNQLNKLNRYAAAVALCVGTALLAPSALAGPAPSKSILVTVVNTCASPISVYLYNNWGSMYTGNHSIPQKGAKTPEGDPDNIRGFIFSSNNDEEYYTISYQNATCKVDYNTIASPRWNISAIISGCDSTPKCSLV